MAKRKTNVHAKTNSLSRQVDPRAGNHKPEDAFALNINDIQGFSNGCKTRIETKE
jgi:hypothetical protein